MHTNPVPIRPSTHATRRSAAAARALLLAAATILALACDPDRDAGPGEILLTVEAIPASDLPPVGTPATVDVGTWNIEWFGDAANGPGDEDLQLANIAYFMEGLGIDLWAVQEVTSAPRFDRLATRLEGYSALLANDPRVVDGARYYSDFNDAEQKVGILYREDLITVDSARVILGDHDYHFAGRPPLLAYTSIADGTTPSELIVVVLHAKAGPDLDDRARRENGARALRAYLDAHLPDRRVLVTGDFNDDIDVSIASGPSPYAGFLDRPGYRFVTAPLSRAGVSSTIFFNDMIDHQLVTDALAADYVDGTAGVYPADDYVDGYPESTSDHLPVTARYGTPRAEVGPLGRSLLRWTGTSAQRVVVYRDDRILTTTPNDGRYLDEIVVRESQTVTYRVCQVEPEVCSAPATAVF